MEEQECDTEIRFQTRFKATVRADRILPFVVEALQTIGHGSACVVRDEKKNRDPIGIQITAPVDQALLLESQIETLDKLGESGKDLFFGPSVLYPPIIKLQCDLNPEIISAMVNGLKVVPPDMVCECFKEPDDTLIFIFSGPDVENRKSEFKDKILPNFLLFTKNIESLKYPERRRTPTP